MSVLIQNVIAVAVERSVTGMPNPVPKKGACFSRCVDKRMNGKLATACGGGVDHCDLRVVGPVVGCDWVFALKIYHHLFCRLLCGCKCGFNDGGQQRDLEEALE